jgi:hypothetical protein
MPDDFDVSLLWEGHDDPERPLDRYVMLCACVDCETAIRNEARRSPTRPIFLKTRCDRIGVTLEYFVEVIDRGTVEDLLYVEGDYVREIYLSDEGWLPHRTRWYSLTCSEDEEADGRKVRTRRVAIRRPARIVRRCAAEAREWAKEHPPGPPAELPTLADVIGPARREHHDVVVAATQWCLAEGQPVDPDLIALICAAMTKRDRDDSDVWTRQRVNHVLRYDIGNWCTMARCWRPDGTAEAVWMFLGFLAATDRLDPDSQPLDRLRDALRCAGLGDDGRPRPDDAPDFRCECNRPYRGPTHGEVVSGSA